MFLSAGQRSTSRL